MSANTAELTLIIRAQNLADAELAKLRTSMGNVATKAKTVASDIVTAFKGIGRRIANQFGNLATDILEGNSVETSMITLGATLAGGVVEGLMAHLIPDLLARLAATETWTAISAMFTAQGVTLGTVLDAGIALGIAAGPAVILGALIAALAYLAVSPEARHQVEDIAKMIIGGIGDGLKTLGVEMYDRFKRGLGRAGDAVREGVANIVKEILSIPDKAAGMAGQLVYNFKLAFYRAYYAVKKIINDIIDKVKGIPGEVADALSSIGKIGNTKFQVVVGERTPRHAEGGWVGLHGPELGLLGERGPEYVVPNHRLGDMGRQSSGGFTIQGISERQIVDMVDRGLYFRLQRAAPTLSRT